MRKKTCNPKIPREIDVKNSKILVQYNCQILNKCFKREGETDISLQTNNTYVRSRKGYFIGALPNQPKCLQCIARFTEHRFDGMMSLQDIFL